MSLHTQGIAGAKLLIAPAAGFKKYFLLTVSVSTVASTALLCHTLTPQRGENVYLHTRVDHICGECKGITGEEPGVFYSRSFKRIRPIGQISILHVGNEAYAVST